MKLHGRVLVKEPNAKEYEQRMSTEIIVGEMSPQFINRARFEPLTMPNSEKVARETKLRFEAFVNGKLHAHVETSMAKLLWERSLTASLDSAGRPLFTRKDSGKKKGRLCVAVVRWNKLDDDTDVQTVKTTVSIDPSRLSGSQAMKFQLGLSNVAERGLWSRTWSSKVFKVGDISKGLAISTTLRKSELTACSDANPVRLELFGISRGNSRRLGYAQFTLSEIPDRSSVSWTSKDNCHPILARVQHHSTSDGHTELDFFLTAPDREKSIVLRNKFSHGLSSGERLSWKSSLVSKASGSSMESLGDRDVSFLSQIEPGHDEESRQQQFVVRFPSIAC